MKRTIGKIIACMVMVGMLMGDVSAFACEKSEKIQNKDTTEYIVIAKNSSTVKKIEKEFDAKCVSYDEKGTGEVLIMELTQGEKDNLCSEGCIKSIEQDSELTGSQTNEKNTSITTDNFQWNTDAIHATEISETDTKCNVKTAVLDSGVTLTEDINVTQRINFIEEYENVEPLFDDVMGHGTSVASVIGARDNGMGVTGVNPNQEIISLKVMDQDKKAKASDVIEALYWCIDNNVKIVNMSFGTLNNSNALHVAIKDAYDAGILLVAAAGNNGETVEYPAAYEEVMAVGSVNEKGEESEFSAKGNQIEITAPGENIPTIDFLDKSMLTDGTSLSTPHIAGMAAVIWEKDETKSRDFIRYVIDMSCQQMKDNTDCGYGIADLDYALKNYKRLEREYEEDNTNITGSENTSVVNTYSETEIKASWDTSDHKNAVKKYGEGTYFCMDVVKTAVVEADTNEDLLYNSEEDKNLGYVSYTNIFHGHRNYIANTLYLLKVARECCQNGMNSALKVEYPGPQGDSYNAMMKMINTVKKLAVSTEEKYIKSSLNNGQIPKYSNNQLEASYILGIAIHIAMDTYAHKTQVKDSVGNWITLQGDDYHSVQDDTSSTDYCGPVRWKCAKEIAYASLYVWDNKFDINGLLFKISYHDASKFKLQSFATYMKRVDEESYLLTPAWYDKRTFEK